MSTCSRCGIEPSLEEGVELNVRRVYHWCIGCYLESLKHPCQCEQCVESRKQTKLPILLWRFEDAPEELQKLSTNGGDEDWLAEIPPYFYEDKDNDPLSGYDLPVQGFSSVGYLAPQEVQHPCKEGWKVRIGRH